MTPYYVALSPILIYGGSLFLHDFFYFQAVNFLKGFRKVTSESCCPVIRVSGTTDTRTDTANQVYRMTGRYLNGRPYYEAIDGAFNGYYGIWYDIGTNWMIGDYANIDRGRTSYGSVTSDENTMCPTHATQWQEIRYAQWQVNPNAHVDCVDGYSLYSHRPLGKVVAVENWSTWSSWSPCSKSCNTGIKIRFRECPRGSVCMGDTDETTNCNTDPCGEYHSYYVSTCKK